MFVNQSGGGLFSQAMNADDDKEKEKLNISFIQEDNSPSDPVLEEKKETAVGNINTSLGAGTNLSALFNQAGNSKPDEKQNNQQKSVFAGMNPENSNENPFVSSANKSTDGNGNRLGQIINDFEGSNLFKTQPDTSQAQVQATAVNPFLTNQQNKPSLFGNASSGGLFSQLGAGATQPSIFNPSPGQMPSAPTGGLFDALSKGSTSATTGLFGGGQTGQNSMFGNK